MLTVGDADLVVEWLNAAATAKAAKSIARVVSIRGELEALRELFNALQRASASIDWQRVAVAPANEQKRLRDEMQVHVAEYKKLYDEADKRTAVLNKTMSKYAFRPGVTYFVTPDVWHFGMVSDVSGFQLKIGGRLIGEGDAVMALVRLASTRETQTVHLCTQCQRRWHVARRSIDKFCSDTCRVTYHTDNNEYRAKKARAQSEYRKNKKRKEAAEDAVTKARK